VDQVRDRCNEDALLRADRLCARYRFEIFWADFFADKYGVYSASSARILGVKEHVHPGHVTVRKSARLDGCLYRVQILATDYNVHVS
jgi:hypothetical protein